MIQWTFEKVAQILGVNTNRTGVITGISTDTRTIKQGDLFIALEGDRFNGHEYLKLAFDKCAAGAVISRLPKDINTDGCFLVTDTKKAYLKLAQYYRESLSIPIIGITGSVGKTSVKEMIALALSPFYQVRKTQANLNNELGVAQTLFSITEFDEAAVVEMGIDHPGDMNILTEMVQPTIAIITNIGVSHLENMGSEKALLEEKMAISEKMPENSPLIFGGNHDLLKGKTFWKGHPLYRYGIGDSTFWVYADHINENVLELSTTFQIHAMDQFYEAKIPTLGKSSVKNALAAISVLKILDLSIEKGIEALETFQNVGMRQRIVKTKGPIVIEDCYNASPDSTKEALYLLEQIPSSGKKIAVLGDMLELGNVSQKCHEKIGEWILSLHLDQVLLVGEETKATHQMLRTNNANISLHFNSEKELSDYLIETAGSLDTILFKGSRGMHLESIIEVLYTRFPKL